MSDKQQKLTTQGDVTSSEDRAPHDRVVRAPSDAGGRYTTDLPRYTQGDPAPSESTEDHTGYDLGITTWQYRLNEELATHGNWWRQFHTLTFAQEQTEESARKLLRAWIKGVKKWQKEIALNSALDAEREYLGSGGTLPAELKRLIDSEGSMRYFVVVERGTLKNRVHAHAITMTPQTIAHDKWASEKLLRWSHGWHQRRKIKGKGQGLGMYLAKYVTKTRGRTLCNSKFGWTTAITLLSIASYKALFLMEPRMAQKLLRRLSLTPNYPELKRLTYLASLESASITLPPQVTRALRRLIGEQSSSLLPELEQVINDPVESAEYYREYAARVRRPIARALARIAAREAKALIDPPPGAALFGRPRPLSLSYGLEENADTAVWFTKSNHPRCRRARAFKGSIRVSGRSAETRCEYIDSSDKVDLVLLDDGQVSRL